TKTKTGMSVSEESVINSIVGESAQIKGDVNSKGSLRISGEIEGNINAQGDILVGEKGRVKGDIIGRKVIVAGEVMGNIDAANGLEITRTGKVYGDISGDKLVVDEGAIYQGKVKMEITRARADSDTEVQGSNGASLTPEDFTSRIYNTIKGMNKA
ncbi:MAG: polymer-forming cytoskeletal protein, partial [bacterium]